MEDGEGALGGNKREWCAAGGMKAIEMACVEVEVEVEVIKPISILYTSTYVCIISVLYYLVECSGIVSSTSR